MKRLIKKAISGHKKNPFFNDGYGIYEYTENGFLKSYSRFCDSAEKPWWVDKYQNNDFGLPIKAEMFLMGKYVRYDTYEYSGNNLIKHSVYDLKKGLSYYNESSYEDGKMIETRHYAKDGQLMRYSYVEYDHLGKPSKGISKSLDGEIKTDVVYEYEYEYEYDNDVLVATINYYPDGEIIRNQYSWEEKDCSVHLINWLI